MNKKIASPVSKCEQRGEDDIRYEGCLNYGDIQGLYITEELAGRRVCLYYLRAGISVLFSYRTRVSIKASISLH